MKDENFTKLEWISASEALTTLSAGGRNPAEIKAMLAEYLRDGHLRARAEAVWVSSEPSLGKAWKTDENADDVERDIKVPVRYWRSDKRALEDRSRWRWPYNKFFYTVTNKPLKRRMFKGVTLSTLDLAKLQPLVFLGRAPRTRGRKPDVEARDKGWIAAVKLAMEGRCNRGYYKDQNDFEAEMKLLLQREDGKLVPGENQVSQIARLVLPLIPESP